MSCLFFQLVSFYESWGIGERVFDSYLMEFAGNLFVLLPSALISVRATKTATDVRSNPKEGKYLHRFRWCVKSHGEARQTLGKPKKKKSLSVFLFLSPKVFLSLAGQPQVSKQTS